MVLKGVWSEEEILENAMKKRSIRICTTIAYWLFRDIYKVRVAQQFVNYEQNI